MDFRRLPNWAAILPAKTGNSTRRKSIGRNSRFSSQQPHTIPIPAMSALFFAGPILTVREHWATVPVRRGSARIARELRLVYRGAPDRLGKSSTGSQGAIRSKRSAELHGLHSSATRFTVFTSNTSCSVALDAPPTSVLSVILIPTLPVTSISRPT